MKRPLIFALVLLAISPFVISTQAAPPGIWIEYVTDQEGPNAGINQAAIAYNRNNVGRQIRIKKTIFNRIGEVQEITAFVPANGSTPIGSTCAFDITYSPLCGSRIGYELLD